SGPDSTRHAGLRPGAEHLWVPPGPTPPTPGWWASRPSEPPDPVNQGAAMTIAAEPPRDEEVERGIAAIEQYLRDQASTTPAKHTPATSGDEDTPADAEDDEIGRAACR